MMRMNSDTSVTLVQFWALSSAEQMWLKKPFIYGGDLVVFYRQQLLQPHNLKM